MKRLLVLAALLSLAACDDPKTATRAVEAIGMTSVRAGGYAWFACGEDDFYAPKFTATNVRGEQVDGYVCSGLLFRGAHVHIY